MVDANLTNITIGLAVAAVTITLGLQGLRATHYDGKLEKLRDKLSKWLQEIEDELRSELKAIRAHPGPSFPIDRVVEIASKFSAVKEIDKRVEELQTSNENSIRNGIVVALITIGAAAGVLLLTDLSQIEFSGFVGAVVWLASIYYTYQFMGEYNSLCERERKRQVK